MTFRQLLTRVILGVSILLATSARAELPLSRDHIARHGVLLVKQANDLDYDHAFIYNSFRVFYRQDGESFAPKDVSDSNYNSVPDYIEGLVFKLETARTLLAAGIHLQDPLTSGFFYEKGARFIDILIKDIPKKYGIASGQVHDDRPAILHNTPFQGRSIRITLHRDLIPQTGTPLHEMFHLFQFNYSEFNNPWFSEGLARWSEGLIKQKAGKEEKLPASQTELEALLAKAHEAGSFWNRLSALCDNQAVFAVPPYIASPEVITNPSLPGPRLVKTVLENSAKHYTLLHKEKSAQQKGAPRDYWPKEEKRAKDNNKYLLQAIGDALGQCANSNAQELNDFIITLRPLL